MPNQGQNPRQNRKNLPNFDSPFELGQRIEHISKGYKARIENIIVDTGFPSYHIFYDNGYDVWLTLEELEDEWE